MTATAGHRYTGLGPNCETFLPPFAELPDSVRDASQHVDQRYEGWRKACGEFMEARDAVPQVALLDRQAQAAAVSLDKKPPAPNEPKARARAAEAQRTLEAHTTALEDAQRTLLIAILTVREQWLPKLEQDREDARRRAQDLTEQLGHAIDELEARSLLADGVAELPEQGAVTALRMGDRPEHLQSRLEQRRRIIEAAVSQRNHLGFNDIATHPVDELLSALMVKVAASLPPEGPQRAAW